MRSDFSPVISNVPLTVSWLSLLPQSHIYKFSGQIIAEKIVGVMLKIYWQACCGRVSFCLEYWIGDENLKIVGRTTIGGVLVDKELDKLKAIQVHYVCVGH
jgi:hypothetical protein